MSITPEPCTPALFGDLMAELPAGVAVVTAASADGVPKGLVVTSLTAYTADPPSLLVSVAHTSRCYDSLVAATHFGVHVLRAGQDDVAAVFASKADDKFAGLDWDWDGDVPRVHGALAYLRCETSKAFHHLDHTVVIGTIGDVHRDAGAEPMLYLRRRFAWRVSG
jgi:flavin reductase (DIM6/NTAB) family NADH-FMN oxidoreductase RutF